MGVKRIVACVLLITLAGCYRQSEDSFAPSGAGDQPQTTPLPPTADIPPILQPTLDSTPLAPAGETPTIAILVPTDSAPLGNATATIVIFEPPTKAAPTDDSLFNTLPTATVPVLITPVMGNPAQVTMAVPTTTSATPVTMFVNTPSGSELAPTPTDLPTDIAGECDYTIVAGDTLFRISLRNDLPLQDLLIANDLIESSIIQPGQIIKIPNCVPQGSPTSSVSATGTAALDVFLPTPTGITTTGGTPGASGSTSGEKYKVKPGDSLSVIAANFGVTVQAIVDANKLTNPNRLSIGQELIIPK